DARARHVRGSAHGRRNPLQPGPRDAQAAGAAAVRAESHDAPGAGRQFRRRGRGPGADGVLRRGDVLQLSRPTAIHRRRIRPAQSRRSLQRWRARDARHHGEVPHDAAASVVTASALLPRRQPRHARRRRDPLQHLPESRAERGATGRSGAVPKIAVRRGTPGPGVRLRGTRSWRLGEDCTKLRRRTRERERGMRWMVLLAGAWWQAWARWRGGLAARIFFAATLLVVVVLGLTFGLTSLEAHRTVDESIRRALVGRRRGVQAFLAGRTTALAGMSGVSVQVPQFRERLLQRSRGDVLDQAEEYRHLLGASWVLVTNDRGLLVARTDYPAEFDIDLSRGALMAGALSGEQADGAWLDDRAQRLYMAVA